MGLAEYGWFCLLNCVDPEEIIFEDYVECGNKLAKTMRNNLGLFLGEELDCNFVVALTHMRNDNDMRLIKQAEGIDLMLGGHDHVYFSHWENGSIALKSGSDYKNLSEIDIIPCSEEELPQPPEEDLTDENVSADTPYEYPLSGKYKAIITKRDITQDVEPLDSVMQMVEAYDQQLKRSFDRPLLIIDTDHDLTFKRVRTSETRFGNFVADIMRKFHSADCAILNSGTLRIDKKLSAGIMTVGDWMSINPYRKDVDMVEVTGEVLLEVLEQAFSKYPNLEGRFPQVSGLRIQVDPSKPAGSRVNPATLIVADKPWDKTHKYKVAAPTFITEGKDGYESFKKSRPLIELENGKDLGDMVIEFFDLAMNKTYSDEYKVYSQYADLISQSYIRKNVELKLQYSQSMQCNI